MALGWSLSVVVELLPLDDDVANRLVIVHENVEVCGSFHEVDDVNRCLFVVREKGHFRGCDSLVGDVLQHFISGDFEVSVKDKNC